jgi:hypothetical protein
MSNKLSETERLLNTIVSAQVRLSGLRGEQNVTPVPTHEAAALAEAPATNTPRAPQDTAPPIEVHETHPPRITKDAVPTTDAPRTDRRESTLQDKSPQNDVTDKQSDSEPSKDVFFSGLSAAINDFDDHPEDTSTFVLGIDPPESTDTPHWSPSEKPFTTPAPAPAPAPSEPTTENDPFSFIDLIPPKDAVEPPVENKQEPPYSTPPPIRQKASMPLPTGQAAGAPRIKPSATQPEPKPSPEVTPKPSIPVSPEPDSSTEPTIVERLVTPLAAPREVEPRILDPDRTMLEVDVFEDEVIEDQTFVAPTNVPKLTESVTLVAPAKTQSAPARTEDQLFDTITDAIAALNHGNLRQAHCLFSDVLDWVPTHIEARLARGRCNRDLGDAVSALSDFLRAQKMAPHAPAPHVDIGDLFFARKDYSRAIAHYSDALAIQPDHALTLCRRGICHHYKKRSDQAIEDLKAAQRFDPEIPNIDRYIRMVRPNPHR